MKEIERNPKWLTSELQYYGFKDIDIVLYESNLNWSPYVKKRNEKIEIWIDNSTTTKEVEDVGRLALAMKIKMEYGLWFPDKPVYWLSILLYMLDGNNVNMIDEQQETS